MPRVAKEKSKHAKPKASKAKIVKTKLNTKILTNKESNEENNKFSFDEEIVIGLKRLDEPTKNKKTKKIKNKKSLVKTNKKKSKKANKIPKKNYYDEEIQEVKPKQKKLTQKQELSKKRRRKIFKIIKILCLISIIIGGIIFALLSPIFNIKNIEVSGNSKISADTIISLSGLKTDYNIFSFWTSDVEKAIKQNAYIDKVEVERKLPDSIQISVHERIPTYMLTLGNAYVYINNQGYILEITSKKLEVPILIGYNTKAEEIVAGNRLNETDLKKLNDVLKIMEATSSIENNISKLITQIDITDKNNYILDLPSEKKKIYLGDTSDLSTKVLWMDKILEDEKKNEGIIYLNINLNMEEPYFREEV